MEIRLVPYFYLKKYKNYCFSGIFSFKKTTI